MNIIPYPLTKIKGVYQKNKPTKIISKLVAEKRTTLGATRPRKKGESKNARKIDNF